METTGRVGVDYKSPITIMITVSIKLSITITVVIEKGPPASLTISLTKSLRVAGSLVERFSRYDLDKFGKRSFFAPTQHVKTIITTGSTLSTR